MSTTTEMANDNPQNPHNQAILFINSTGAQLFLNMTDLDTMQKTYASAANYGMQFGMNIMVLLFILLFTPVNKLRLPICLVNIAAIFFGIIRETASITEYSRTHFYTTYAQMTWAAGVVDSNEWDGPSKACQYLSQIAALVVTFLIELLLFLHASVMLSTLRRKYRIPTLAFLIGGSVTCLVVRTMWAWYNIRDFYHMDSGPSFSSKMQKVAGALVAESVAAYSVVFTGRILVLLYRRSKLGVQKAKYLHVLAFVSLESMLIPVILVTIQWSDPNKQPWTDPQTWMLTSVAILMPFGSIWASRMKYRKEVGIVNLSDGNLHLVENRKDSTTSNLSGRTLTISESNGKIGEKMTKSEILHHEVPMESHKLGYSAHVATVPFSRATTTQHSDVDMLYPDLDDDDAGFHGDLDLEKGGNASKDHGGGIRMKRDFGVSVGSIGGKH